MPRKDLYTYIQDLITNLKIKDKYGIDFNYKYDGTSGLQVYQPLSPHTVYLTAADDISLSAQDNYRPVYMTSATPANSISTFELVTSGILKYALNSINYKDNWNTIQQDNTFSIGEIIYFNSDTDQYELATSSNLVTGMVTEASSSEFSFSILGLIENLPDDMNLVAGTKYFVSVNNPGQLETDSANGKVVFQAITINSGYFYNFNDGNSNTSFPVHQVGHNFIKGNVIYFDINTETYELADAGNPLKTDIVGVVSLVNGDDFVVTFSGKILDIQNYDFIREGAIVPGATYYLTSGAPLGEMTIYPPSGTAANLPIFRATGLTDGYVLGLTTGNGTIKVNKLYDPTFSNIVVATTSAGYIGIGTLSPTEALTIQGAAGVRALIRNVSSTGYCGITFSEDMTETKASGIFRYASSFGSSEFRSSLDLTTDSTGNIFLRPGGYVAIGTITPSAMLDITGPYLSGTASLLLRNGDDTNGSIETTQIRLGFSNTDNYQHYIATRHNTSTISGNSIDFYTSDGTQNGVFPTNAVHGMSIYGGKVGIGIKTPLQKLQVDEIDTSYVLISDTSHNMYMYVGLEYSSTSFGMTGPGSKINAGNQLGVGTFTASPLIFATNDTERMNIDSDGLVQHIGFTKLGSDAPEIKIKQISIATSSVVGTTLTYPHGVDWTKIISATGVILCADGKRYVNDGNNQFSISFDSTNLIIKVLDANALEADGYATIIYTS